MPTNNQDPVALTLNAYKTAIYAKDVSAFSAIYDENVCVFDMWGTTSWMYQGIKAWRSMAEEWFGSLGDERVVVDIEQVQSKQTPGMAFVSAFVKYTAVSAEGKTLRSLQNRMTCVLEPKDGVWKITHEQTSSPADHSTLKVSLQRPGV
jgi:ketosteroid isomerase-like protein